MSQRMTPHPTPTQLIVFVMLLFAAVMSLAGCTPANEVRLQEGNENTRLTEVHQVLSDGRTVTCLKYKNGYAGGLSCDWANAREASE